MDGDSGIPHDFFSQTAFSGAAAGSIDGDGWGLTPPRSGGRVPVAGGLGAPGTGVANLDLNADCAAAASYPNMSMYTHILQPATASGHSIPPRRARSDDVPQHPGRPPRQGLPPVRASDRRGKAVTMSGQAGAGTSRAGSGRQRQAAPILVDDIGEEAEDDEDESMLNQHRQRPKSKANFTEENMYTLCEIACEEIEAGNFTGGTWSNQAYKNMKEKYWERTNLWHPGREIKNKMASLKILYSDWVWLQQQTGVGRGSNGEVTASPAWWESQIKDRPNLKKFRKGNPEYMHLLHEIFHEVAVDGNSAYVMEKEKDFDRDNDDGDFDANEGFEPSPMSTNSRKRGSSSVDLRSTATSPSKKSNSEGKTKSPFVRCMQDLKCSLDKEAQKSDTILQILVNQGNEKARRSEERAQSVAKCQSLAIECGATEETIEYWVACDLSKETYNRWLFQNMRTPEARLTWLKRWCKAKKMYDADGGN